MPGRTTYYSLIDTYYSSNSLTTFRCQWHDVIFYDLQNSYNQRRMIYGCYTGAWFNIVLKWVSLLVIEHAFQNEKIAIFSWTSGCHMIRHFWATLLNHYSKYCSSTTPRSLAATPPIAKNSPIIPELFSMLNEPKTVPIMYVLLPC